MATSKLKARFAQSYVVEQAIICNTKIGTYNMVYSSGS